MRLTNRSEYALLALIYLARHESEGFIPIETIAQAQEIPPKFLQQILLILKRSQILKSSKGQAGGYALAVRPEDITLAEVVRMFDGPLAPTASVSEYYYDRSPIEKEPAVVNFFREIRDYTAMRLETTTIADLRE